MTVLVSETTLAVELDDADVRVSRRTTTEPVRSIKDSGHGPLASNFLGHMMHIRWQTATVELVASFEDLECLSSDRPKQSSATMIRPVFDARRWTRMGSVEGRGTSPTGR